MKIQLLDYSQPVRVWLLLMLYALQLAASLWIAYELRFDFMVESVYQEERLVVLAWLVPFQLLMLAAFHQLTPLLGYFSTPDLARVFHALSISAVVAILAWAFIGAGFAPPRGVIVVDFLFGLVGITGVRLLLRAYREMGLTKSAKEHGRALRVAIVGAGDSGATLAHELSLKPGLGLIPVAFYDDDKRKWHSRVHDIPVVGPPEMLTEDRQRLNIEQGIIAMPSGPAHRVGEIARLFRQLHLPAKTVPSIDQLAHGQVRISQLRHVEIQDLLGRDKVELETESIRQILEHRVVMVTGAGGSIGSELCRQIASYHPAKLLLVERSEPLLFQIEQELIRTGHAQQLVPLVADIMDRARMESILSQHQPKVVFHAAAHKHVPMMEHQPGEAIRNNTFGTAQVAELSVKYGVDRFVLISTDKAINPTSVMGATKRLAEMFIQSLQACSLSGNTKLMAVRFGNVLGSSGSVIPVFQRQIAEGGPVRVTHPDMTRYFMTIPEASMLVLQSAMQGQGGEIFVLDMGKPVRIVELARQMIELSGLKPDEDIRIEFSGVRPGEKLFEEITHSGENFVPTNHAKIFRFISHPIELDALRTRLQEFHTMLNTATASELKAALLRAIPDYTPFLPESVRQERAAPILRLEDQRTARTVPLPGSAHSV